MRNLTSLKLQHMDVVLPSLACIAQQLVELDLEDSALCTGCSREDSTAFLSAFVQLERANFTDASLDASLAATQLPSLRELSIGGFTTLLPDECRDYTDWQGRASVGTGPFAHGCPSCERISLDVGCGEISQVMTASASISAAARCAACAA